ncbi:MAG: EndoU domain-containing protein [Alphaproteobacteria bacterium]
MLRDRFLKRLFFTAIALIVMAQLGIRLLAHVTPHGVTGAASPQLTAARAQHILYGDSRGGGHLHGAGRPCKSEFPADWSADKVILVVTQEAANDNLSWRHERNGNDVAEVSRDGVKIRLVVNGRHDQIITAYPLNTPRNLCPAAANDNKD